MYLAIVKGNIYYDADHILVECRLSGELMQDPSHLTLELRIEIKCFFLNFQ